MNSSTKCKWNQRWTLTGPSFGATRQFVAKLRTLAWDTGHGSQKSKAARHRAFLLLFRQESQIEVEALADCQTMGIGHWLREGKLADKIRKGSESFRWDKRVVHSSKLRKVLMSDE
jgi:hypothetical protein